MYLLYNEFGIKIYTAIKTFFVFTSLKIYQPVIMNLIYKSYKNSIITKSLLTYT